MSALPRRENYEKSRYAALPESAADARALKAIRSRELWY